LSFLSPAGSWMLVTFRLDSHLAVSTQAVQ